MSPPPPSGTDGCTGNKAVFAFNGGEAAGWGDFDNSATTNYQDTSGAPVSGTYDAKTTVDAMFGEWLYHAPQTASGTPQYGVNITNCNFMYISLKEGPAAANWTMYAVLDFPSDSPTGVSAFNVSDLQGTSQGNGWTQYKIPLYPSINGTNYPYYLFTGKAQTTLPDGTNTFYKFGVQDHSGKSSNYWYGTGVYFTAD